MAVLLCISSFFDHFILSLRLTIKKGSRSASSKCQGLYLNERSKGFGYIPAFNEEKTIGEIVNRIRGYLPEAEIIVINDGSDDDTAKFAHDSGAIVFSHPYNIGNGAAVKSGIRTATGEVLVFMDDDGQHDPADIDKMLACFPDYDIIVGARTGGGQASFGLAAGNKVYNWLASYVTKFSVKDLTSGSRAVKADIARSFLYLLPNTYSYPTTITLLRLIENY